MKRSIGVLRQGYHIGASTSQAHLQSALPFPLTSIKAKDIHSSAYSTFLHPTHRLQTEHHLDRTSSSSSTANNPPPPLLPPGRKRAQASRINYGHQLRPTNKESIKSSTLVEEEKRASPSSARLRDSQILDSSKGRVLEKAKESQQQFAISQPQTPPSIASTSKSSTQQEKKSEPTKSLTERIKSLWENIKYLFRFYYQGTKQIWTDRNRVKEMRLKIADREAKTGEGVRWMENAIIKQHESDLGKLPLFLAILLILEEVLPLLVIYAPSLLPSTCILPSQSAKMRSGEERLRGSAIQDLAKNDAVRRVVDELVSSHSGATKDEKEASLNDLGPEVSKQVAPLFALSARGPQSMVVSRIHRHIQSTKEDDILLLNAFKSRTTTTFWKEICESDWLWKACARRGLRAFEADAKTMEHNLIAYLYLISSGNRSINQRALLPLALYDGTMQDLIRLQTENQEETSKGIRQRTIEVVKEVKEAEQKKESK